MSIDVPMRNLIEAIKKARMVWVIGNGGSCSSASHLAEDLLKLANKKAMALDSSPLLTMSANDFGIENMFLYPLMKLVEKDDLVIGITMGGKSKNILKVVENKKLKCNKFVITGLGGKDIKADKLMFNSKNIQVLEDACLFAIHSICIILEKEKKNGSFK